MNIGPGEFIKEELDARNWRQEDLADILGVSLKSVNQLIQNKQSITIEMAKLLSRAFGQSPQYWLNLDSNYRLRLNELDTRERDVALKAEIYKHMPINEMIRKGWLKRFDNTKKLVEMVKRFWQFDEIDFSFMDKYYLPNFRRSEAYTQYNKYFALTWFQMAKNCARLFKVSSYNANILEDITKNYNEYTLSNKGVKALLEALKEAGVKFFVLSHLQKTYIDGASFFDNDNPVIVYTKRYNRVDNFYFTLAHEIAHVLLHLRKKDDFFIDNLDEIKTEQEKQANKFAERMLKANEIIEYFKSYRKYISQKRVFDCADELKISPAIVVGVLQHYGWLSRRNLNRFKTPIEELIPNEYYVEKNLKKIKEFIGI